MQGRDRRRLARQASQSELETHWLTIEEVMEQFEAIECCVAVGWKKEVVERPALFYKRNASVTLSSDKIGGDTVNLANTSSATFSNANPNHCRN